jgi:two-component system LytT family sensor kinase
LTNLRERHRLFWILQTSGWLLFLASILLYNLLRGVLTTRLFTHYSAAMTAGFLTTLLFRSVYKKIGIHDRGILWISLLTIVFSLIGANLTIWLTDLLKIPTWGMEYLGKNLTLAIYLRRFIWWLTPLVGWSVLYIGLKFWREWMFQREKAEKAKALAQTAQLQMLRYRMNPHFLFNTLNSIRALIAENKAFAKSMVTELSEYLRYSLVSKNYERVPFKEEIDSIRHYFNIQKMRYEYKLNVRFEVDTAADEYPIISFLLHPLVENAVRYGLCTSPLPLRIQVKAGVQNGILRVDVINSGSWVERSEEDREDLIGKSLDNLRQRLAEAYPGRHQFEIHEKEGTVQARLTVDSGPRR